MAKRRKTPARSAMIRKGRPHRVFVSHATADKWLATVLCEKIEAVGATTFRDDRDIAGGDDIPEKIRSELVRSQELLVLMTPDSVNRAWVLLEVGAFWGRCKGARIVAVMCHVEVDTIPDLIRSKKAIPLNDFDAYLGELTSRVRGRRP